MKRKAFFHPGVLLQRIIFANIVAVFCLFLPPLQAQDEYYSEEDSAFYWDESGDQYYYDEEGYYEEEPYYYEDSLSGEDQYYDDTYFNEEVLDEYLDEEPLDEGIYGLEETTQPGGKAAEQQELSSIELAERAQRIGYSITFTGASPGFVNHALMTYNSHIDYRIGLELPMLMQVFGIRFRLGFEYGTFSFQNYMPVGGEYVGNTILGLLSFPAGPGQVKLGVGRIGGFTGFIAETSYGIAIGNILDLRLGVRSTTAQKVVDSARNDLGTTSWLDGIVTIGVNF